MDESIREMIESLLGQLKNLKKYADKVTSDMISSPIGRYNVQTGPSPFPINGIEHPWMTVIGVDGKNGTHYGPVGVEMYEDEESALKGHDVWRRNIMDSPPLILKDMITKQVTFVGS